MGLDEIGRRVLRSFAAILTKPIHHLSTRNAVIPPQWKIHKVFPVFKSGYCSSVKFYHPTSLQCNTFKVLECLIYNKILSKITDCVNSFQFGFQKTDLPYNHHSSLLTRSSPVALKLMLSILTSARLLILYVTTNFW